MTTAASWVEESFKQFGAALNGKADAAQVLREQGLAAFSAQGFPSSALEDWKYTNNFSKLSKKNFKLAAEQKLTTAQSEKVAIAGLESSRFVFVNGRFAAELSAQKLPAGVTVVALSDALSGKAGTEIQKEASAFLAGNDSFKSESLVAMNLAFLTQGLFIKFAKNTVTNQPIEIVYLATNEMKSSAQYLRNLVVAEDGVQAQLIERFESLASGEYFTNVVANFSLGQNARVEHFKIQNESLEAVHYSKLQVTQLRDSFFSSSVFAFGSQLARNEIDPVLNGEGIDCQMRGLTVIKGEQHVDNTTLLDHAKPHCQSTEHFKGIYADKSKGVFSGTIIVRPDAQKTNAFQANDAVLLSNTASIESRPQLKIWADDVRCTHGATMGQLDDDALFYIRSRGIDLKDARKILVQAFAGEITETVTNAVLREYIQHLLAQKLNEIC